MNRARRTARIGFAALWSGVLSTLPGAAQAIDLDDRLTLNGFYTVDVSQSSGGDVILPTASDSPIVLKDGETSTDNSLLGLQADLTLNRRLRLTTQGIFSKQRSDDYVASLEWAYLTYDLGTDAYLRGGKLKLPFLQGTELRYVGFSRLWARPLVPSNGAAGFDEYLGAELLKSTSRGGYNLRFQGAAGVADHQHENIENDAVHLLSVRAERDESWVNVALFHAQYDIYRQDSNETIAADTDVWMGSMEAELLRDNTVLNLGLAGSKAEDGPDEQLAYLSLGYRAGDLTPYLLYHYRLMSFDPGPLPPPPALPPPPGAPPPPPPKDGDWTLNSYALGLRYDLTPTIAIKAQAEHQAIDDDTGPQSLNFDQNIYTIVLEGVF